LLARHRSAEPKLDAVRQQALASIATQRSADTLIRPNRANSWTWASALQLWHELFSFRPRAWAGLAAAWLLIFALNYPRTTRRAP